MDSRAIDRAFRRLFAQRPCASCTRPVRPLPLQRRHYRPETSTNTSNWQQRTAFSPDMLHEYKRAPMVDSNSLRSRTRRPRRVKMLMRDFIEDSLYNPHYGYFSKQATIFSAGDPFDFRSLPTDAAFRAELGTRYTAFEDKLDEEKHDDTRQLWHTPTELFSPYYGETIARYLIYNYKLSLYPYHDLLIYELGAGNGTMMLNILDYIREANPEVYERTQYRIIEVSSHLASLQEGGLHATASSRGHADKVRIINKSIFDWTDYNPSPCFFLALEVFDNFAHDLIRYDDPRTRQAGAPPRPHQATVLIDSAGDFHEFDDPVLDPVAERYLSVRAGAHQMDSDAVHKSFFQTNNICPPRHRSPQHRRKTLDKFLRALRANIIPWQYQLSGDAEYIPTRQMQFFDVLKDCFPAHRLVASDFHALPDAVPGRNAPVVQTRYRRRTVPVTTPLVHQGYFDILFPTDFAVMEDIYRALTGKLTRVSTHEEFVRRWAYLEDTRTANGENPLLSWYQNASFITTV